MTNIAGNFIFLLFALAIIAELVSNSKGTSSAIDATSGLLSNSIKAAKS